MSEGGFVGAPLPAFMLSDLPFLGKIISNLI